ncbi:MAG: hypothetical protein ACYCX5_13100 [Coriobacteriia bacterium]
MPRSILSIVLVGALGLSLIGIVGCDELAESAAEKAVKGATGIDVDSDSGEVTLEGDDGSSTTIDTENATVPDGWPDDAPYYDGTIESSWENTIEGKTSYSLLIETDDAGKDVIAWYEAEFEDGGWAIKTNFKDDSGGMLVAEKGEWQCTVATGNGDEKSVSISEIVGPKQ